MSFLPPWEFQTPLSLGTPGLLINLPRNWLSHSSAFSKPIWYIWKFSVHILLKPSMKKTEYNLTSMWNECYCRVVWTLFGIALLWDWNEKWPFPVQSGNCETLRFWLNIISTHRFSQNNQSIPHYHHFICLTLTIPWSGDVYPHFISDKIKLAEQEKDEGRTQPRFKFFIYTMLSWTKVVPYWMVRVLAESYGILK